MKPIKDLFAELRATLHGCHAAGWSIIVGELQTQVDLVLDMPIPMRLQCPECHMLHIDEGELMTKPHHTHSCQSCGMTWRPAVVNTVGVRFLPGFKNEAP